MPENIEWLRSERLLADSSNPPLNICSNAGQTEFKGNEINGKSKVHSDKDAKDSQSDG